MSASTANVNPLNITLSPMRVKYKGVDLGGTVNAVTISIKFETADIMVDQFGKSIIDKVVNGLQYSIKTEISEIKNTDNWQVVFPSSHEVINGGVKSIYMDMQVGDHLLTHAGLLVLHPLEKVDADLSSDYNFFKAVSIGASEIKYGPDKQSGLSIEWIVFPDTSVVPAKYMIFGDPSNGLTAASAGSPVAGGGNVGNETITSVAVFNGVTKTEVITVQCVGASSGNDWSVSGSISGPLGTFHIAAANGSTHNFVSPVISFTMNQNTVQAAYGDSFTISTTASNYS